MAFQRIGPLFLAALLVCCGRPAAQVTTAVTHPDPFSDPVPHSREADDAGRFLAGMPGKPGSAFAALEEEDAWKVHRRELDHAWKSMEDSMLPGMRAFQAHELSDRPTERAVAFYPFSGPDALVLTVLFPRNPVYVMVALEPAGTLPTPATFAKKDLTRVLGEVRESVASELHRSFFITRQMDSQFRGQVNDGLFPPILHLLVRTNHTILGYRSVRLDERGDVVDRPESWHSPGRIANRGVEIEFQSDADGSVHKLFYFSVNLADDHLKEDPQFLAFVAKLKGMTTYFKATSYMTHKPEFSMIRDSVLANSAAVLQDDSGIPYKYFAKAWQVQLFGSYSRPYGSFRWLEQPDLRKAYETTGPKPLNFKIGYGFSKAPSNLLLARKAE
ncbi:MAG TPA: hypothetical protein VME43_26110 [Bryobacteraceae bacterium]|nr:hypothetical protein [Bryobacteraceae bacterium]